jgi:hypothetical protein
MRGRRIIAAMVVGCGVLVGLLPGTASGCLLACGPGGSGGSATLPSASAVTVGAVAATRVTLTGTVGTGGASTFWQFIVDHGRGGFGAGTSPANPASAVVTSIETSATAGTHYTVQLQVTNSVGTVTGPAASFTTPLEPALGAGLVANRAVVAIDSEVKLTGTAHGANATNDVVQLQEKAGDARRYSYVPNPSFAGNPDYILSGNRLAYTLIPLRNARYRFRLTGRYYNLDGGGEYTRRQRPSVSKPISVIVDPIATLNATQARPGRVDATASFTVHALPGRYRGEPVYIYLATSRSGPFRLIGAPRLRYRPGVHGTGSLSGTAGTSTVGGLYFRSCVRHEPLPDMGRPFTNHACGSRTLR